MDEQIRAPRCPGCDRPPDEGLMILLPQAFCNNPGCRVFSWDIRDNPATFKAKAKIIDLPDLSGGKGL